MICTVDDRGYCARHQRVHPAEEMRFALENSPVGEGFRLTWDKQLAGPTAATESATGLLCTHLDDAPIERGACGTCTGKWKYPCDVHGVATPIGWDVGVKRCDGCAQYHARNAEVDPLKFKRLLLVNNCCPGDVVVMSAAIESLHRTYPGKYVTAYAGTAPELFEHNPHVSPLTGNHEWEKIEMKYPLVDLCDERPVHFMHGYCAHLEAILGVPVPLVVNRPYLYLSPDEKQWLPQVAELTGGNPKYWLVNAGFKDDYPSKWWGSTNYQKVVDLLRGRVLFVQIGELSHTHRPLSGVIDMRGKTTTRQLVRMVHHAAGGLGPSTFLQHLCAALEKPYVCLAGGREPVAWQHYQRQATLSTIGVTPCSTSRVGRSCWVDRASASESKPTARVCELPVVSGGGEYVTACLESIRPERVAEEILARYNRGATFR